MLIINDHLAEPLTGSENVVAVSADRSTLAKRRWRGIAGDGREFGFDLEHPLSHGDPILRDDCGCYAVFQMPEPVLEVPLPTDTTAAASLAWQIGNLHFPVEITHECLRVADDPALRQMFDREGVAWSARHAVFRPLSVTANGHHH